MAVTIIKTPKPVAPTVPFQCMLAASEIPSDEVLVFPLLASFKLDGIRCNIHHGVAMSRTMIRIPNQFVQGFFSAKPTLWHGLDGELTVGGSTGDGTMYRTTSGINSAGGQPNFMFNVFEDFSDPSDALTRYAVIQARVAQLQAAGIKRVNVIEQVLIHTLDELKAYYAKAIALGYEGLILKKLRGLYKNGRSTLNEGILLKWKEFIYFEARITGVDQGTRNENPDVRSNTGKAKRSTAKAGKTLVEAVGSFQSVAVNGPYEGIDFSCGPGVLPKARLKELWLIRDQLPGQVITVKAQKAGAKDKPRYPGCQAFRPEFDMPKEGV